MQFFMATVTVFLNHCECSLDKKKNSAVKGEEGYTET